VLGLDLGTGGDLVVVMVITAELDSHLVLRWEDEEDLEWLPPAIVVP
jgi:hypothetical protein